LLNIENLDLPNLQSKLLHSKDQDIFLDFNLTFYEQGIIEFEMNHFSEKHRRIKTSDLFPLERLERVPYNKIRHWENQTHIEF